MGLLSRRLIMLVCLLAIWPIIVIRIRDAYIAPPHTENLGLANRSPNPLFTRIPDTYWADMGKNVEDKDSDQDKDKDMDKDQDKERMELQGGGGSSAGRCVHPMAGKMDVVTFHGVGDGVHSFRRTFRGASSHKMKLWLNFYFCDVPMAAPGDTRVELKITMQVFILKGLRLELYDIFGRLYHSMTIFRSLKYIVNHHHDEKTLRQEKVVWEKIDYLDEFLSEVTLTYSQDLTRISSDGYRTTDIFVTVRGNKMPVYSFQTAHSLEIIQTLMLDCVSYMFDCADVAGVTFQGLSHRTRKQDLSFQLHYFSYFKNLIDRTAQLVTERSGESSPIIPPGRRGTAGKLRLLIGTMSSPGRFEFRLAQRQSWMIDPLVRSGAAVFKFFVSASPSALLNKIVEEEARIFGDVVFMPETEVYLTISYKVAAIFEYMTTPEWDHQGPVVIGKSDDDVYTNVDALYSQVASKYTDWAIFGRQTTMNLKQQGTNWYWFVADTREYKDPKVPYMGGPFYALSAPVVRTWLALEEKSPWFFWHQLEDRQTALWMKQYEKSGGRAVNFVNMDGLVNKCNPQAVVLHHVVPDDMDCLYNKEKEMGTFTCCRLNDEIWH